MAKQQSPTPSGHGFGTYVQELRTARNMKVQDLADRAGTDRTRIWKYESGREVPKQRATMDRLAGGYTPPLNAEERRRLYESAGFRLHPEDPQPSDFARVADGLRDEWLTPTRPPVVVTDLNWTIWFASDAFASLFTTAALGAIVGRNVLEVFFEPTFGLRRALSRLAEDSEIDAFLRVTLVRFRANKLHALSEPRWRELIDRLRAHNAFAAEWKAVSRRASISSHGLLALQYLNLREGGRLIATGAPSRLDPRFYVVLYLPSDVRAATVIERVLGTQSP